MPTHFFRVWLAGAVFVGLFTAHAHGQVSDFTFWLTGQTWAGVCQHHDGQQGRWVDRPGTAFLITFEAGGRCHVLRGGDGPFGVTTTTRWTESAGGVVVGEVPGSVGARDVELLLRAAQQEGALEAASAVFRAGGRERFVLRRHHGLKRVASKGGPRWVVVPADERPDYLFARP